MYNKQFNRLIKSCSMKTFVDYYDELKDMSISDAKLIDIIRQDMGYKEKETRTRVSKARRIIRNNLEIHALSRAANSKHAERDTVIGARKLLQQLGQTG